MSVKQEIQETEFIEGDAFPIIVPLDKEYSFDFGQNGQPDHLNQTRKDIVNSYFI